MDEANSTPMVVKAKFWELEGGQDSCEPARLRMRLIRKTGDRQQWYSILQDLKDAVLDDILLAPLAHQEERLTMSSEEDNN